MHPVNIYFSLVVMLLNLPSWQIHQVSQWTVKMVFPATVTSMICWGISSTIPHSCYTVEAGKIFYLTATNHRPCIHGTGLVVLPDTSGARSSNLLVWAGSFLEQEKILHAAPWRPEKFSINRGGSEVVELGQSCSAVCVLPCHFQASPKGKCFNASLGRGIGGSVAPPCLLTSLAEEKL